MTRELPAVVEPLDDPIERLVDAYPASAVRDGDIEHLARAAGVPVAIAQQALDDPQMALRLLDSYEAAEGSGVLLKPTAARVTLAMLLKLRDSMARDELDVDDIGNLLPKVHRVVEHAERIEAAQSNSFADLPVLQVIFTKGAMTARVLPPGDVIDVESVEVDE